MLGPDFVHRDEIEKHRGPGPHKNGTPQSVHSAGARGPGGKKFFGSASPQAQARRAGLAPMVKPAASSSGGSSSGFRGSSAASRRTPEETSAHVRDSWLRLLKENPGKAKDVRDAMRLKRYSYLTKKDRAVIDGAIKVAYARQKK